MRSCPPHDDTSARPTSTIERERKFVIDAIPTGIDLSDRTEMRQGYLVTGEHASVRVRDAGPKGCTLDGQGRWRGAERTELEWAIDREQFDAAWPHTEGRRVVKVRYRIPLDDHVIELDVFGDGLEGLVFAEVEFDSSEALVAFEPPPWFGREVTDDGRYTNAALALHGRPDRDEPMSEATPRERRTALDVGDRTRSCDPPARCVERRGARPLRGTHP